MPKMKFRIGRKYAIEKNIPSPTGPEVWKWLHIQLRWRLSGVFWCKFGESRTLMAAYCTITK
jgi:hypothetical protein